MRKVSGRMILPATRGLPPSTIVTTTLPPALSGLAKIVNSSRTKRSDDAAPPEEYKTVMVMSPLSFAGKLNLPSSVCAPTGTVSMALTFAAAKPPGNVIAGGSSG